MTTSASQSTSSTVGNVEVTSAEPLTTQPDVHDSDESIESINVVDNYETDDNDCVCDYDVPTQPRFSYVVIIHCVP